MTDHPLTEDLAAELWDAHIPERKTHYLGWRTFPEPSRRYLTAIVRASYDAGSAKWKANAEAAAERAERAEEKLADSVHVDEDDRPWVPLGEDDPLNAGDEVRQDCNGVTTTAVVASVDDEGDPFTAENLIGLRKYGTWHVRRAIPELPTEDGSVIVPAVGHNWIVAKIDGTIQATKRLTLTQSDGDLWYWIGLSDRTGNPFAAYPEDIVPGTWLDTTR